MAIDAQLAAAPDALKRAGEHDVNRSTSTQTESVSITPYTIGPAVVVCAGAVLFFLGWQELGLVLMLAPIVLGLLVTLWYLLRNRDE